MNRVWAVVCPAQRLRHGRGGKGREGKGREGKGREGKWETAGGKILIDS
jgi:hypothetical protein